MYRSALDEVLYVSGIANNFVNNDGSAKYRQGTWRNDHFNSKAGDTLAGSLGDDTYVLWQSNVSVLELAGEGIDTIIAQYYGKMTLPANVENLVLSGSGVTAGTGNALNNIIWAGAIGATLDGAQGNDVLVGGTGADVFRIAAGNGSDAIVGFKSGADVVKLDGYGVATFADLMRLAWQDGADTRFVFGNGEQMVLRDVNLWELHGYDFGFAIGQGTPAANETLMEGAGRCQNWNGWYIINNTYNTGGMTYGKDFTVSSKFDRSDATGGTTFTWTMPYTTEIGAPIRGYPEVAFGVPPLGAFASNPGDKAAVFPVKVGDLVSLTADYDVDFSGNVAGFNVAYDIWFTSRPNGDRSTVTNEVMIWVHKGDVGIWAPVVGTYQIEGVTFTIYHKGTYTAMVVDRDLPAAKLDLTAIFDHLTSLGILSDNEYLASIELGAEVVSGVGSLTINNLDLSVTTQGANGGLIVKEVTGAGQTITEVAPQPTLPVIGDLFHDGVAAVANSVGVVYAKLETRVDGDAVHQRLLSQRGVLLSTSEVALEDGQLVTERFSRKGVFIGSDVARAELDGSITTEHYDLSGKLLGAENRLVTVSGEVQLRRYDADLKFVGAEVMQQDGSGQVTARHYNAAWALSGVEVKAGLPGNTTIVKHYDTNLAFAGQSETVTNENGSVTVRHYDENLALRGHDEVSANARGVIKSTVFDEHGSPLAVILEGTDGRETLSHERATTIFRGGFGSDSIEAAAGADVIIFDSAAGHGDVDRITGFSSGEDRLVLDQSVFTQIAAGRLSADAFHIGKAAQDANDRIIYNQANGKLLYDADGNGAGAAVQFAKLSPHTFLSAQDIEVVHSADLSGVHGTDLFELFFPQDVLG